MSTPGFGFKNRKLYVFVDDRIMLLEAWPSLKEVQKYGQSSWMEFAPRFRLLFDETQGPGDFPDEPLPTGEEFQLQRRRAFGAFRANIPVPVATAVEKFQTRQWKLLQLMQKSPAAIELAGIMISHLLDMKRIVAPDAPPPRIHSLACLRTLHDMVLAEFLRMDQQHGGALPKPPIPGTKKIVPILTGDDLREEGKTQNNCVGGYVYKIREGKTFIYRVLEPERATLEIIMTSEGDWIIGQLKCHSNTNASAATRQTVQSWLDQYALSVCVHA